MRDAEQEDEFARTFIVPERRERYRLLLANPRRRSDILDRLSHNLDFIPSLARQIPGGQHNAEGVVGLLNDRGVRDSDPVYVISDGPDLDAQTLPMRQAVRLALDFDFGSVICCLPGRLAYYRPEAPENGYLLEKPARIQGEGLLSGVSATTSEFLLQEPVPRIDRCGGTLPFRHRMPEFNEGERRTVCNLRLTRNVVGGCVCSVCGAHCTAGRTGSRVASEWLTPASHQSPGSVGILQVGRPAHHRNVRLIVPLYRFDAEIAIKPSRNMPRNRNEW